MGDINPTPESLDTAVAEEVMGWHLSLSWSIEHHDQWVDGVTSVRDAELWRPSEDIAAAWDVEERIAELGLQESYADWITSQIEYELCEAKGGSWDSPQHETWTYLHATPRQRCLAALAAVRAQGKGKG